MVFQQLTTLLPLTEKVKLIDQIKSDLEALKARVDALESKP